MLIPESNPISIEEDPGIELNDPGLEIVGTNIFKLQPQTEDEADIHKRFQMKQDHGDEQVAE